MTLRLHISEFDRRLRKPMLTANVPIAHRAGFELQVWDGEDLLAKGECSPLVGFSFDSLDDCLEEAEFWQTDSGDISSADLWLSRSITVPHLPALRCAAETLAIQLATRNDETLPDWPERVRHRVRTNALVYSVEDAILRAEEGFDVIKAKVGHDSIAEDVRRIRDIRKAVGDQITLRLDANRAWSFIDAQNAIEALAPYRIQFLEEPLKKGGPRELAELRSYSIIPLAADEQARNQSSILDLIDEAAMDILILKPMLVGGPIQSMRLAKMARQRGTSVIVTTTIDGPTATAMAVEVAARLPEDRAHGLGTSVLFEDQTGYAPIRKGVLRAGETT